MSETPVEKVEELLAALSNTQHVYKDTDSKLDRLLEVINEIKSSFREHLTEDKYVERELRSLIVAQSEKLLSLTTHYDLVVAELRSLIIAMQNNINTKVSTLWFRDVWKMLAATFITIAGLNAFIGLLHNIGTLR